jgi:hypothetical protein
MCLEFPVKFFNLRVIILVEVLEALTRHNLNLPHLLAEIFVSAVLLLAFALIRRRIWKGEI